MSKDVPNEDLVVISMAARRVLANAVLVASASNDGILVEIIDTEDDLEEIDKSKDLSVTPEIGAEVKNIRTEKSEKRNTQFHHIKNTHPRQVGKSK